MHNSRKKSKILTTHGKLEKKPFILEQCDNVTSEQIKE